MLILIENPIKTFVLQNKILIFAAKLRKLAQITI